MAVSNVTPSIQYTGNGNNTDFAFTFVVPALQTGNTITDATASITSGSTTLTVTTSDFFYTSALQGKSITVNGAGANGANLETTINTRTSGTVVELTNAASTTVSNATITVTTGLFGTAMKNTDDIEVYVDGVKQTYTTHYTVLLNVGDASNKNGTVQFVTAPANASTITIVRDVELSRTTDFQRGGALTSKDLNAEFDNIVMALQDNIESAESNALKFPADELVSTTDSTLPAKTSRANKLLAFDANGTLNLTSDITSGDGNVSANVVTANTGTFTNLTVNTSLNATVTGTVSSIANHTTDNLSEGSNNLYHTNTRVNSLFDTRLATKDTGDLTEGTNLYHTNDRVNTLFDTRLATKDTGDLAEGSNLYYTAARDTAQFQTDLANSRTTHLQEGTNLYYTDARADARITNASVGDLSDVVTTGLTNSSGAGNVLAWSQSNQRFEPTPTSIAVSAQDPLNYNTSTGVFSLVQDGVDATHIDFGTGTNQVNTDDLFEGSNNLYFTNERVDDRVQGLLVDGTGITRTYDDASNTLTLAVDGTVLRQTNSLSVSNKQIDLANNTLTGTLAEFNTALSDGTFASTTGTETLTNKTIELGGTLNTKGNAIITDSNGDIDLTPNGTGDVNVNADTLVVGEGNNDATIKKSGSSGDLIIQGPTSGKVRLKPIGFNKSIEMDEETNFNDQAVFKDTVFFNHASANGTILHTTGNLDIQIGGTGNIILDGQKWPDADGTADQVLKTDGAGNLSYTTISTGGLGNLSEDTTPQLGADLDVNGHSIVSVSNSNINITPDGNGKTVITNSKFVGNIDTNGQSITSTASGGHVHIGGNLELGGSNNIYKSGGFIIYTGDESASAKTFQIDSAATSVNNFVTLEANEDTAPKIKVRSSTNTNSDLDITALGTGKVNIDDLNVTNSFTMPSNASLSLGTITATNADITNITNNRPHFNPQTTDISNIVAGYGNAPIISAEADVRGGLTLQQQSARNDYGISNRLAPHTY